MSAQRADTMFALYIGNQHTHTVIHISIYIYVYICMQILCTSCAPLDGCVVDQAMAKYLHCANKSIAQKIAKTNWMRKN